MRSLWVVLKNKGVFELENPFECIKPNPKAHWPSYVTEKKKFFTSCFQSVHCNICKLKLVVLNAFVTILFFSV